MEKGTDPPPKRPCHSIRVEGAGAGECARPPPQCENKEAKPKEITILDWNVASLRKRLRKNLREMTEEIKRIQPNLIVLTEVRCQLSDLENIKEWREFLERTGMKVAGFHSNPIPPRQERTSRHPGSD